MFFKASISVVMGRGSLQTDSSKPQDLCPRFRPNKQGSATIGHFHHKLNRATKILLSKLQKAME